MWTDECSIACSHGQVYVTHKAEEKYLSSCCIPKFRGYSAHMFWGCISSQKKGTFMVFEKDWGKVTGKVYCDNVVPLFHQCKRSVDLPILMEDGASVHTAKATQALHCKLGILKMKWPANSPKRFMDCARRLNLKIAKARRRLEKQNH
jgi:hypothetical protein